MSTALPFYSPTPPTVSEAVKPPRPMPLSSFYGFLLQGRAGQGRAGQGRAGQGRAGQENKAGQGKS